MNRRGNIKLMLGVGLVLIISVALIFGMLLLSGVWTYAFGTFTKGLTSIPNTANYNISTYTQTTFGNLNTSFQTFRWWSYVIIFALFFGILICFFLVKQHPVYFVIYFIFVLLAIVLSIFISNAYERLTTNGGAIADELNNAYFTSSWMVLYLPELITVIAFVGAVILFVSYAYNQDDLGGAF